jgi:hypothetical protein
LAAGVSVFQLARIMGTSVRMIERHYGALLDGSGVEIAGRLDALDAQRERKATEEGLTFWITTRSRPHGSRRRTWLCSEKRLM